MNENLEKLKLYCRQINYSGNISDEFLFTVNCVDYFFYNKNMGPDHVKDGMVDGANDGGIDFIYSDSDKLYLIQGKSSNNIAYNDIRDIFYKMLETYNNLVNKKYLNYSDKLKKAFINNYEFFVNEPDISLVLFTNTEINDNDRNRFADLINSNDFNNFTCTIYDGADIESKYLSIDQGDMTVKEGYLELDRPNNHLSYQNEKGAIFSIKANSLKTLYFRYHDSGLFGYNLREHISEKKVDGDIDETIKNNPDSFWYLNNGITIACSDYLPDGNKLKLYDFSIINGAQTTTKIGTSKMISQEYDFPIVCKVVKSEKSLNDDFIRKISEASNSQKPIKPRDLRANSREQQLLQKLSADNGMASLAIDIKRGVKPSNVKKISNQWQRVTNEYLGQLILACFYQQPGAARSQKSDIFGKDKTYNLVFSYNKIKDYDYDTIFDLVKLARMYDEYKIIYSNEVDRSIAISNNELEKKELQDQNDVCQNGKFIILALLFYLYKRHYLKYPEKDTRLTDQFVTGRLTLDYSDDDIEAKLRYFFNLAIEKLSYIYNNNQVSMKLSSHSNFFKTNSNYYEVIIPAFEKMYKDQFDKDKLLYSLSIFDKK